MKYLIALSIVLLTACTYQVSPNVYNKAYELCYPNGGLKYVTMNGSSTKLKGSYPTAYASCNNGVEIEFRALFN